MDFPRSWWIFSALGEFWVLSVNHSGSVPAHVIGVQLDFCKKSDPVRMWGRFREPGFLYITAELNCDNRWIVTLKGS